MNLLEFGYRMNGERVSVKISNSFQKELIRQISR